jgi:serine/threonine protein kinase
MTTITAGGTPLYMAPELLDPEKFGKTNSRPTQPADMYAFGMVMYEVLTGFDPFYNQKFGTIYEFARHVIGGAHRVVLWDDLRFDPHHRFTVVQETEIFGVEHRCRKQPYRTHWACDDIIRAMRVTSPRFKWTIRVIALIEFFMLTIANLVRGFAIGSVDGCLPEFYPDSQAKARSS